MTLAQHKIFLAQKIFNTDDKHLLKMIETIFEQKNDEYTISAEDRREIDRRLANVESGKAKLYTVGEMKKIVRKNFSKRTK